MSAQGIFTNNIRFKFVDGQETTTPDTGFVACGDGTAYPMEATLDQIAEILYRVKDAYFIEGEATITPAEGAEVSPVVFYAPTTATSDRSFYTTSGDTEGYRGYTTETEVGDATISAHNDPYLGDEYTDGVSKTWRDIADNERGMWLQGETGVTLPFWSIENTNAFSFYTFVNIPSSLTSPLDTDCFQHGYSTTGNFTTCEGSVIFNGEVAVIKLDPGDSYYAPTNRYFIGLALNVEAPVSPSYLYLSTLNEWPYPSPPTGWGSGVCCNYVIRLSSGDISCPIYGIVEFPDDIAAYGGSDFIHEAQIWWPYAKGSGGGIGPVWDTTDGSKL